MPKKTVSPEEYIALLNREISRNDWFVDGMYIAMTQDETGYEMRLRKGCDDLKSLELRTITSQAAHEIDREYEIEVN